MLSIKMSSMNKLTPARRVQVLTALAGGNSIRSTVRMTCVAKGTVTRLLESAGKVCADYQNEVLRNLPCKRIQCDEIWSFVYGKDRNIPAAIRESTPVHHRQRLDLDGDRCRHEVDGFLARGAP